MSMRKPNTQDIDYVPYSPIEVQGKEHVVETTVATALEEARIAGISSAQAGRGIQAGRAPQPVFHTPNAFSYLRDLLPDTQTQARMINLHAEDVRSAGLSVTMSYPELGPGEVIPSNVQPPWPDDTVAPARDHAAWMRFGAGGANHHCEFDCGEGNTINVPGAVVEVTLVDWTFLRDSADISDIPPRLVTYAHASSSPIPGHAIYTTRVMTFYQVEVDLLVPPTIEAHMANLLEACTLGDLID